MTEELPTFDEVVKTNIIEKNKIEKSKMEKNNIEKNNMEKVNIGKYHIDKYSSNATLLKKIKVLEEESIKDKMEIERLKRVNQTLQEINQQLLGQKLVLEQKMWCGSVGIPENTTKN